MSKMEIKTRIVGQPDGSGKLTLTVKNGWWFWRKFAVKNSKELRDYLKSDEFKEFAYSVFSKYEGLTYKEMSEMYDADSEDDFKKIWDKLDRFAWVKPEYSDDFHIKITKRERLDEHWGCYTSYMYITGRIYNKDMSQYRRFNTIVDFCIDDIYEEALESAYYDKYDDYDDNTYSEFREKFDEKYNLTDKKIKDYTDMLFYDLQASNITSYDDIGDFYQICKDAINDYNERLKRAA
jgi:hypothetical protein